jgi:hypothetical protein
MYKNTEQKQGLARMHRKLADEAQSEVLKAYQSRPGPRRPSYREQDTGRLKRYSGGKMEQALRSKKLIVTSYQGIGMYDQDFLDRKAKQWYRLNFGALPQVTRPKGQGSLKMFGQSSSRKLQISKFGASSPFMVPTSKFGSGLWSNKFLARTDMKELSKQRAGVAPGSGKNQAFYVVYRGKNGRPIKGSFDPVLSRGIKGTRFLDAGVKSINDNYGDAMRELFLGWHKKSLKDAGASNRTVRAPVKPGNLGGTSKQLKGLPPSPSNTWVTDSKGRIYFRGPRGGLS